MFEKSPLGAMCLLVFLTLACVSASAQPLGAQQPSPRTTPAAPSNQPRAERSKQWASAAEAMKRASTFFTQEVAAHGGFVYHYSSDLQRRWGEGEATQDQIWVQPPGTPTVGLAFLAAYDATGDVFYLDAAREAAEALCYGQLKSGGWTNCVDFDPQGNRTAQYRNGKSKGKNNSSLDDGQTQSALRFLLRVDQALNFQHAQIHEATQLGLDSLLAAQFSCGAFPQVWVGPVGRHAAKPASFPDYDWRTEGKIKDYWTLYTLNDDLAVYVAETLREAMAVTQDKKYMDALRNLGDFLVLAQLPEPQPAWAQQYNFEMQPVWARRFEPPAVSGHESQGVIGLLMDIYQQTGDRKYLQPIPAALDYLRRSQLADGQLARYYELRTNRPLFMQRSRGDEYELTYDDSNLPDHYGWMFASRVAELRERYEALVSVPHQPMAQSSSSSAEDFTATSSVVANIIDSLDPRGAWLSRSDGSRLVGQLRLPIGEPFISSEQFSQNLTQLAEFIATTKP